MDWNLVNFDAVTIEDCEDLFYKKNIATIINDGKVIGFDKEEKSEEK